LDLPLPDGPPFCGTILNSFFKYHAAKDTPMSNMIALSPHFPENFAPFWARLKAAGVQVLGLADVAWEALNPELQAVLEAYWRVENMHDIEQLTQACWELQQRHGRIQWLESHNEYWLETEAELRRRLDIAGPHPEHMIARKRKSGMQALYQQAGVPVAPGVLASSWTVCQNLIAEVGFPVVAKPDIGVGAAQTYKLSSLQELEAFWQHKPDLDYFVQSFITGELYSFDGLVNAQGELVFCASHHFSQGIMEVVNQDLDLFYYSLREIPDELRVLGERTLAVCELRERFFHFEFFLQPDGTWVALEVNLRPPGGWTTDMMNFACDTDIYAGYAELLTTGQFHQPTERQYHVAYVGRKQRSYRLSHTEVEQAFGEYLVHQAPIAEVFHPVMGTYGYLLRSPDLPQLKQMISAIQEVG